MERKKIFEIFGGFLGVMFVFTILSRAVSGAVMARVETTKISTGLIEHKVSASGKTEAGKEVAVYTQSGQRVKEICVEEGQTVEEGDVLFLLELEELEEQILAAEQELEKMKLQGQDARSAQDLARRSREQAKSRAAEDYNTAVSQGDSAVAAAKTAWERAEQELQNLRNTPPGTEDRTEPKAPEKQKGARENTGTEDDPKDAASEEAKQGEEAQTEGGSSQADAGDSTGISTAEWEAQKSALEQAAAEAKAAYEAALSSRAESVKSAARAMEDAALQPAADSSARQNEIAVKQQELVLKKLSKIMAEEGKVTAPVRGMVTKIAVTTGDFTTDGTAVRLADTSKGCRVTASVGKEHEKYVSKESPVTITASGKQDKITDYTVSNVVQNDGDKNLLDVTIELPEGVLEAGTSVEIEISQKSKNYNTVLPIQAIHEEQTGCYVLILQEQEGILGKELVVKRLDVEVADKNATQAALAEGMLTKDQEVISSSSRMINDGSRVRRKAS